jgi:hypothetical protein
LCGSYTCTDGLNSSSTLVAFIQATPLFARYPTGARRLPPGTTAGHADREAE